MRKSKSKITEIEETICAENAVEVEEGGVVNGLLLDPSSVARLPGQGNMVLTGTGRRGR